ncbi:MAG: flavodoxin [archaeon]|nr:MAG: flavodoxin [archaeon]
MQVIYSSRTGNTRKVAEAMASEIGTEALDVRSGPQLEKGSVVFLGSGCYASRPDKKMLAFIEKNSFNGIKVALFGTSGSGEGKEVQVMEQALREKGAVIKGRFFCRGKFLFSGRGHPSQEELSRAREFARKTIR